MLININDFGAVGDGTTLNTSSIQKAIDEASKEKNTVYIPAGVYLTGTLNLKGASLYLENNAVLKGSPDLKDYPEIGFLHNEMGEVTSLLYSMNEKNIHISGYGTIDFSGEAFYDLSRRSIPLYYDRPLTEEQLQECNFEEKESGRVNQSCFFHNVENLTIEGVRFTNAPCWTISISESKNVKLTNLTIDTSRTIHNNDGIHISACDGVVIKGCHISSGDDCIAITGITNWNRFCENIVISDCVLTCCSKSIVLGYMYSLIRNVTVTNCTIYNSNRGLCIMASAGKGCVENVIFSNMTIDTKICAGNWWGNGEPICILGIRHDNGVCRNFLDQMPERNMDYCVRNIIVTNLICTAENAIGIVGDGVLTRDITLQNIYYQAKESKNIDLKGRILDTNPAPFFVPVEKDCFLRIMGAENVYLNNVNGDSSAHVDKIVNTKFSREFLVKNAYAD